MKTIKAIALATGLTLFYISMGERLDGVILFFVILTFLRNLK